MNDFFASPIAGWVAIALMAVGGALTVFLAISLPNSPFKEKWDAYVAYLNQYVRFLLLKESAQSIAQKQAVVIAILLVILAATGGAQLRAVQRHFATQRTMEKGAVIAFHVQCDRDRVGARVLRVA